MKPKAQEIKLRNYRGSNSKYRISINGQDIYEYDIINGWIVNLPLKELAIKMFYDINTICGFTIRLDQCESLAESIKACRD